jgi:diguanylate cyclase (GGDEF)-like protein/PAS domain S-box-containing protein
MKACLHAISAVNFVYAKGMSMDDRSVKESEEPYAMDDGNDQRAIRVEQLRLAYRNASTGIAIYLVNSLIVAAVISGQVPHVMISAWLAAVLVVALLRMGMIWRYRHSPTAESDPDRWAGMFCIGAGLTGATWGAVGLASALYLDLPYLVFVAFVIGGMALGALAVMGAYFPGYLFFLVPSLLPMELGLLFHGEKLYIAMGTVGAVFIVALYVLGRRLNAGVLRSIKLAEENSSLVDTLRHANTELQQITKRLGQEVRERHLVEAGLRESEARYRAMFERNEAVKLLIDPETGYIVQANPAASAFYGYSLDEFKKLKITDINTLPPEEIFARMSSVQTQQRGRFEFRHRLASGDVRDVEVHSSPLEVRGKKLLFSIIQDITNRKQAENALKDARDELEKKVQERTRALTVANEKLRREISARKRAEALRAKEKERAEVTLHSIGDAVIRTDADGNIEYMNPIAEAMTGWRSGEAQGRAIESVFRVVDERSLEPMPSIVAECIDKVHVTNLADRAVLVSRSGEHFAIQDSVAPIVAVDGSAVGAVLVFTNVTESRRMAREIAHQATHDALTGLVNRREFEKRLQQALLNARQSGIQHALCYIDLDRFKFVNDTAGHVAGDELLRQVAHLLMSRIRGRDTLARLGGDEFGLLLENCPISKAVEIAESLVSDVRRLHFSYSDRYFDIGASVGVAPITAESERTVQILNQADKACYLAKQDGRSAVRVYWDIGRRSSDERSRSLHAAELRGAMQEGRFHLYCQPIVPLSSNGTNPAYYEILLRLQEREKIQLPDTFLPAAERYGMMTALDRWVIRASCVHYAESIHVGRGAGMSINLSDDSLNDDTLVSFVLNQLTDTGVPAGQICFEIKETAAISNLAHAANLITKLKDSGCRFALDDFGRGLSSLTYLKQLPVDYVKIDGGFVQDMTENKADFAMVEAVNKLSHTLGIQTIAEYVESSRIVDALGELGVDFGQGYAIGSPVPLEQAALG